MSSLCWWNASVGPPYLGCSSGNMLVLILLAPSSSLHRSRYICHHSGCRFGGIGEALRGGIPSVFAWRQLLHGGGVLDFPLVVQTDHEPGRDIRYSLTHTLTCTLWSSQEWREQQHTMWMEPLYFPGYLSLYVVYVIIVIVSSFIYQRQKRLMLASSESTSVPGYGHKHTDRQPMKRRNKYRLKRKHRLLLQSFTRRTPRMMTFLACSMGTFNKNMVDLHFMVIKMVHLGSPWWHVCVCVFQSRSTGRSYHPLSLLVRSCWPLWTQWTAGSGGGNHGAGESSKYWRCVGSQVTEVSAEVCPERCRCSQMPVEVLLLLCIPVVDPDKEDKNWRRPLNCLHLITAPLVCVLAFQSGVCKCLTCEYLCSTTHYKINFLLLVFPDFPIKMQIIRSRASFLSGCLSSSWDSSCLLLSSAPPPMIVPQNIIP